MNIDAIDREASLQRMLQFSLFPNESLDSAITRAIDLYILSTPARVILCHVTMLVYCRDLNASLTPFQRQLVEQLITLTAKSSDWYAVRRRFRSITTRMKVRCALDDAQMTLFSRAEECYNRLTPPVDLSFYFSVH